MSALRSSPSLQDNPLCTDWLDLSQDGEVTLKTAKVEIGQGILTALVQIAADELDISPDRIEVISGHTGLGPVEAGTSSSLSVEVTGRAIRLAASAVRQTLLAEAATLLQSDKSALGVVDGAVQVEGRETPLSLWTLAQTVDLAIPALDAAAPKLEAERRLVGTSLPRRDLAEKAASAPFIHDLVFEGMRHGRALQPPAPNRPMLSFDENALAAGFPDIAIVRDGSFVGVIADREEVAMRAIEKASEVAIWAAPAAAPSDIFAALADTDVPEEVVVETGIPLTVAGRTFETTITKPFIAHASIAPSCAIANWQGDKLEVYSHTQSPHGLCDGLAIVFDCDAKRDVTVIHSPGAGTYGHSGQDDAALDAAILAKRVPGTPVRVIWSRADDFAAAPLGSAMVVKASAVLDDAGRIAAYTIQSSSEPHARRPGRNGVAELTAAAQLDPPLPTACPDDVVLARGGGAERNAVPLYAIPNVRVSKRILKDLPYRGSALRSLGSYANVFALETLMDDLAYEAGADPVAFRLDHMEDERACTVIARAAEMAGWPGPEGNGEAIGIAFAQYKNKSAYSAVAIRLRLDEEVHLISAHACADAGEIINPDGIRNQIEGSIIQAASWTLKEAVALDGDTVSTQSWADYPILTFSEIPHIEVELINHKDLPWLGVGETAVGPTGARNQQRRPPCGRGAHARPAITRDKIVSALS